jgi:lyso-ornithine lipid O-acyltransferase
MRPTHERAASGLGDRAGQASVGDAPSGPVATFGAPWLSAIRLFGYAVSTMILLPVQLIALLCWPSLAKAVPRIHHRIVARIIGLKVRTEGNISHDKSVFFVSNHVSYFDIIALGSIVPASFVAKSDVAAWPIFGFLARVCRTLFIERRSMSAMKQIEITKSRLDQGDSLIVFPEGTSSDGSRVLPFKSTLFATVEGGHGTIQPVSIRYTRLNGMPIGRALRPFHAWYGDMDLAPHLWSALSLGSVEVMVRFHAPVTASDFSDRKKLARYCQAEIANGIGSADNLGGTA